ncbi:MAG: Crp/Fnr family transcriptional regulator [Burkholderiaceae bacterium]|jgi:CRP-like cAMP-binding protein|nr:Crp/Fnr family transcriptional regulator [Burkholderiaceae bacterium]
MDLSSFDIPRYLSVLPLFHELQPVELERLAQGSHLRQLTRGENVFHVGQPCTELHVVVSGQIKLFALSPQGHEKIIEIVGADGSCAEALMFLQRPYIVNAQALAETRLLSVARQAVMHEIENNRDFCMRMLAGLSRRLHGLISDVQAYALQSGVERVIGYLLRGLPETWPGVGAPESSVSVTLPVSKAAIASRLSMTPEYFSRVLHELESQGLIVVGRREITISDLARLTSLPTAQTGVRVPRH